MSRYFILAVLVFASGFMATQAMGADLIAHWPFDQNSGTTVEDVVGGFNGEIMGGKALWGPGKFGNGLELQGPSHYVEVEKTKDLELEKVTLISWVNFKTVGARQEVASYADSYGIFAEAVFRGLTFNGGGWPVVNGVTSVKPDTWYQVALTADGNEMKLYVDGKLDATLAAPAIVYQNFALWFGGGPADNQFWLTGIIDEIEIWNDVLDEAEIEELFTKPPSAAVESSGKLAITWGDAKSQ